MAIPTRISTILDQLGAAYRPQLSGGTPAQIDAQVSSYIAQARDVIEPADANANGYLTKAERGTLPGEWKARIEALGGAAPTTSSKSGLFGISGTMAPGALPQTTILAQGLNKPTSLAFNPHDGTLWVVSAGDDSSVVLENPGQASMRGTKYGDNSDHFMNNPMQIAFSPKRNEFAVAGESGNDYNGQAHDNMFMGPTLFTADREIYNGGAETHLDMLHHSPFAVGICAGKKASSLDADKREYWVFNGQSGAIDRYFFHEPHELGGHDHHDGQTFRYAPGDLQRVPGVPSHLALDGSKGWLYVADTGNGRIAKLDTKKSIAGAVQTDAWHGETPLYEVPGTSVQTVAGQDAGLVAPSGLVLHKNKLVVSDYETGHILVLAKDGTVLGDYDTGRGRGGVVGLAVSPEGELYFTDMKKHEVVKLG